MNETIVKLADRKIKLVVKDLNKVLDSHKVFGQEWICMATLQRKV